MDEQEKNDLLIRIDARTARMEQDAVCFRNDIKELYGKVDDINKEIPKITSIQCELTEHKDEEKSSKSNLIAWVAVIISAVVGFFEFKKGG